jgi:hypothetical protein
MIPMKNILGMAAHRRVSIQVNTHACPLPFLYTAHHTASTSKTIQRIIITVVTSDGFRFGGDMAHSLPLEQNRFRRR